MAHTNNATLKRFKGLAIGGGGMAGISIPGALSTWIESGYTLEQFKAFAGTSVGSLVAALLSLRADPDYISNKLKHTNFKNLLDASWTRLSNMWGVLEHYGWYKGTALREWIETSIKEISGDAKITLKQAWEKYETHLIITKVDVLYPKCKLVTMDYMSHPNKYISEAVCESCAIPYIFRAIYGTIGDELGHIFVDGGVLLNYPITTLYNIIPSREVMGLCLSHKTTKNEEDPEYRPVKNNIEFIESIAKSWRDIALKSHIEKDDWRRTCNIAVSVNTMDFDVSVEKLEEAYEDGKNAMKKFIKKIRTNSG